MYNLILVEHTLPLKIAFNNMIGIGAILFPKISMTVMIEETWSLLLILQTSGIRHFVYLTFLLLSSPIITDISAILLWFSILPASWREKVEVGKNSAHISRICTKTTSTWKHQSHYISSFRPISELLNHADSVFLTSRKMTLEFKSTEPSLISLFI